MAIQRSSNSKLNSIDKLKPVIILVALIWGVYLIEFAFGLNLSRFGIIPRNIYGLRGIVLAPFLHANIYHLSSNTLPLLVLSSILFLFYYDKAYQVFFWSIIISGIGVWVFGRPASHIGISGIIYALATFLIATGFYKGKFLSIVISIAVVLAYGGMVWGLLPGKFFVSYEAHIAGAISGVILARIFFRKKK